jgi:hypothetical protein
MRETTMSDPQLPRTDDSHARHFGAYLDYDDRPGCLSGLLKLFALGAIYKWLQRNFGFGRGCLGTGCGIIFFVVAALFFCSIVFSTNWFDFGF